MNKVWKPQPTFQTVFFSEALMDFAGLFRGRVQTRDVE